MPALDLFHPAIRRWFQRRFPEGPTEPQEQGWASIATGVHTLIAAPTGSGKTLAAFLVASDRAFREFAERGYSEAGVDVVYVSPLKALASDIQQNLQAPLREIQTAAFEMGLPSPELRVVVRSGDTPAAERVAMLKRPPHFLITTPESLFLLLTAEKSRALLTRVRTLIVDEIHAVAGSRRGSHLALSLERLAAGCSAPPQRIGLSATQRPIEAIASWLVGAEPIAENVRTGAGESTSVEATENASVAAVPCQIVDLGHQRALDLALEVPGSELAAVASNEQWGEILDRIAEQVRAHRTTLVFVNTRRLAERLAHQLAERLGEEQVAAHHGSLSKERRHSVEARLRAGELRALVATASLELGIDIGPIELVCQIGSPRSFAAFLQRVGRSGHARGAVSKGRLYPATRDELVECAALLRGARAGRLDELEIPRAPLDILAQQIVAACAAEAWREDALFALVRRAMPYAELLRAAFNEIVELLCEGIQTGRGRRAAYLHRDRIHRVLRARRGARLAALTSGGAIPETADYRVVVDPDETFVGTVNEDWAVESQAGDIFLLGTHSWRIRRVENGVVRVVDAEGAPPTIPFWLGEAPTRTRELSQAVSELRAEVTQQLEQNGVATAATWLNAKAGVELDAAEQIARYLAAARAALGVVPTQSDVVLERFFDEAGGMQLVVHAPFGGRVNRAFGLALRKRFCRRFDFELQAAANDDALLLSLGPQHSFPLADVLRFVTSRDVEDVYTQAVLTSPLFQARWRWNLGRALIIPRQRGGKRVPPPIQRMEADDLLAAVFPRLAACQENATGPIEIPDHPLVRQTLYDCRHEAADVDGLRRLLADMESGTVRVHLRDTTEPSPLAHEILNGRPFTFLDDAPLEERRSRAVALRRGLPETARDLAALSPDAIARVREEAAPAPRDVEELHDLLRTHGVMCPEVAWETWFRDLVLQGRAAALAVASAKLWFAAENLPLSEALFPGLRCVPELKLSPELASETRFDAESAARHVVRGHLESLGPTDVAVLVARTGLTAVVVELALVQLEAEGFALRGHFDASVEGKGTLQFCSRRLLARIHAYTREVLRREIEPVSAQDFVRFLLRWQHVAPHTQREGRRGLLAVLEQLQGSELPAGAWEAAVLPARVAHYRSEWLDSLCLSGAVVWGRAALSPGLRERETLSRAKTAPSRATPLALALREDWPWWLTVARGATEPPSPERGSAADVLACLNARGALFISEIVALTKRLPIEVEEGLWELVSRGAVTADGFQAVRTLLRSRVRRVARRTPAWDGRQRMRAGTLAEGRWSLFARPALDVPRDELALAVAQQLLARWGVLFRDLLARESLALPWREILYALRRLEARGVIRGGRFVAGFVGEQFALPGAVEALRHTRRLPRTQEQVVLSAADPLNLVGILSPGPRVPVLRTQRIVYCDGAALPLDDRRSQAF